MKINKRGTGIIEVIVVVGILALLFPKVKGFVNTRADNKVEQKQEQVIEAKQAVEDKQLEIVKDAQLDVRATGIALDKENVELAKDFNEKADGKLGVAVGPIKPKENKNLELLITGLMSEVKEIREQAEKDLAKRDKASEKLVDQIDELINTVKEKDIQLTDATNALQEKNRELAATAQKWYYTCAIAFILLLGWLYQKFTGLRAVDSLYAKVGELGHALDIGVNKATAQVFDAVFDTKDKPKIKAKRIETAKNDE